jgi:ACS family hexuronate transporter-like MFS transporter
MDTSGVVEKIGKYRWMICLLLFANTANNYLDRQMLGILSPELKKTYGWTDADWAFITNAFQVAYALGLPFFGRLVDKFGTRATYAWATVFWGFAAFGHGLCYWITKDATVGSYFGMPFGSTMLLTVAAFATVRFFLGIGEAVNFPAAIKAVTEWFPKKERALATGIFNSGANIGAVIAPALVPWIAINFGWPWAFVVGGSINFIFILFWWPMYRLPQHKKGLDPAELRHILSDNEDDGENAKVRWLDLLTYRETWAFVVGKAMTDPIWWFFMFWLPMWLNSSFKCDLKTLGWPLVIVYSFVSIGSVGGGYLSSALIHSGKSINFSRKMAFLLCALCVMPIFLANMVANMWIAALIIGLAMAAHAGWSANIFTLASDCFPKRALASVVGLGGFAGTVASVGLNYFVGWWLTRHPGNYMVFFVIAACAYSTALLIIHLLVPRIRTVRLAGTIAAPAG